MSLKTENIGFFCHENDRENTDLKNLILDKVKSSVKFFQFNQYANYKYHNGYCGKDYLYNELKANFFYCRNNNIFFYDISNSNEIVLISATISDWDLQHFGFGMANLNILISSDCENRNSNLLNIVLKYLKKKQISVVNIRVNGDDLHGIHGLQEVGFKYYEGIIWPIAELVKIERNLDVRLYESSDLSRIKDISFKGAYSRGHFYCDKKFPKPKVDLMYEKWIDSAVLKNDYISVIEFENKVAGFFVFGIDTELENRTGYKYGRLKLLSIDSDYKGKGLGEMIFSQTLAILYEMGCKYVDSGYITKNHISSKLHTKYNFYSVHEETRFHLWLK